MNILGFCVSNFQLLNFFSIFSTYSYHKIRGKMQVFDFQLNGPSIYYEVNIKAFGKKKKNTKDSEFRIGTNQLLLV